MTAKPPLNAGQKSAFRRVHGPASFTKDTVVMANHDPELYAEWQRETKANGPGGEAVTGYIGQRSNIAANGHREGWLRDQCVQWLKGEQATDDVIARDPNRPLCLYFSLDFPHAGLNPPAEFEDLYDIDDIVERPLPPWAGQGNEHRPSHLEGFFDAWQELRPSNAVAPPCATTPPPAMWIAAFKRWSIPVENKV